MTSGERFGDGSTGRESKGTSTAAVLWLMILLVFVPISAAHVVALLVEGAAPATE